MNAAYKYDILENQNGISTNAFGLRNTVKGMTSMNHGRNLASYAEELVASYAKYENDNFILFFLDLPEEEQGELTRLFLESTDRDTSECVYGDDLSINSDFTCALLSLLQNDTPENRENFAEITRKNSILYFQDSLQDIIDEACNSHLHNVNNEAGYYTYQDTEHDEVHWSKFE